MLEVLLMATKSNKVELNQANPAQELAGESDVYTRFIRKHQAKPYAFFYNAFRKHFKQIGGVDKVKRYAYFLLGVIQSVFASKSAERGYSVSSAIVDVAEDRIEDIKEDEGEGREGQEIETG